MDATKLHLLFNYLPLIGTAIGPIVLVHGARKSNVKAQMTGFGILVLTAIATLVVFGTGEAAGKGTDLLVGQVWTNIQEHRRAALPAFAMVEATGIFALFGAINLMRKKALTMWLVVIIVLLSIASIGFTARTAYFGRSIHRVETPIAK